MKKLFAYSLMIAAMLGMHSCGDDDYPVPVASTQARFTFTVSNGAIAPATVSFTNKSVNASSYEWEFGNGMSSTEENPSVEYSAPGTYKVKLTVTSDNPDLYYNTLVEEAEVIIRDQPVKKLFFTDRNAGNVKYVALDDSPFPILQGFDHTGLGKPYGMSVDTATGMIYVTDAADGIIYRYDNDGSNLEILLDFSDDHLDLPYGINIYQDKIYWADQEGIIRADLDGSNSEVFIPIGTDSPPELVIDFTIDDANGVIYFTNDKYDYSGGVYKVNLDGSGMQQIVEGTDGGGIVVDPSGDRLYYYDYEKGMCINNLDGSNEVVFDPGNAGMFTWGMAMDKEGGFVYYPNRVTNTVMRAQLDGSGVTVFVPAEAEINPNAMTLDRER